MAGMATLTAALPWFIHHPSSDRNAGLAALTAACQAAYLLHLAVRGTRRQQPDGGRSTILWATAAWAGSAVLSQASLPWSYMLATARSYWSAVPGRDVWDVVAAWWHLPEALPHFSVVAAVLTVQAAGVAWMVSREVRANPWQGAVMAWAQVAGLLTSVVLGLIEASGLVDLTAVRGSQMVHLAPGSIQGATGNRGWFAEYVAYALPYVVMGVSLRATCGRRLVVGTMLASALTCLLLAFQRGGWLVGTLMAACSWAVLLSAPLDSPARGRTALLRCRHLLLSGMTVIVCAVVAVRTIVPAGVDPDGLPHVLGNRLAIGTYLHRLQAADVLGGRETYWPVAAGMLALRPVIGGGVEAFAYRYALDVTSPAGPLHNRYAPVPHPASAHNLYLQTLVGTGVLGLAALLSLWVLSARGLHRIVTSPMASQTERLTGLAAGGSLLAIAIFGFVQEVTYVHGLRVMLVGAIGLISGLQAALHDRVSEQRESAVRPAILDR